MHIFLWEEMRAPSLRWRQLLPRRATAGATMVRGNSVTRARRADRWTPEVRRTSGFFGDSGVLKIETVDQFISYASVKTATGCLKVSVVRGVDFFTDVAADRVLKTIVGPVSGNVFLLLSQNSRRILPTIRSRVQIMKVKRSTQEAADL